MISELLRVNEHLDLALYATSEVHAQYAVDLFDIVLDVLG